MTSDIVEEVEGVRSYGDFPGEYSEKNLGCVLSYSHGFVVVVNSNFYSKKIFF